jgi:hypothetical protein
MSYLDISNYFDISKLDRISETGKKKSAFRYIFLHLNTWQKTGKKKALNNQRF